MQRHCPRHPPLRAPGWSRRPHLGLREISTNLYRSRESKAEQADTALHLWTLRTLRWSWSDPWKCVCNAFTWKQGPFSSAFNRVKKTLYKQKYNTSKIFGEMLDMASLQPISKTMNQSNVESDMGLHCKSGAEM